MQIGMGSRLQVWWQGPFYRELGQGMIRVEPDLICRHHTLEWIRELLEGFQYMHSRFVRSKTMHGHSVHLYQSLYRLPT